MGGGVKERVISVRSGGRVRPLRSRYSLLLGLPVGVAVLLFFLLASVRFGAASIGTGEVISAFTDYGGSEEDLIVRTLRVPRALIAALLGAILLVSSDIAARVVARPQELPVGVMTALVGAPFFVYLVRWRVKR